MQKRAWLMNAQSIVTIKKHTVHYMQEKAAIIKKFLQQAAR